jgi:hypothetical protein
VFSRGSSAIPAEQRLSVAAAQTGRAFDLIAKNQSPSSIAKAEPGLAPHRVTQTGLLHLKARRFRTHFGVAAAPFLEPENRSPKRSRIRQFLWRQNLEKSRSNNMLSVTN